jgi:D-sedoheptulose 7-phosphate isomerase
MKKENDFSVVNYFNELRKLSELISVKEIEDLIEIVKNKYKAGNKIFTCGNGGSASTASHYITDWNKMVNLETGEKFQGYSLCDNIGIITAYANDISYDQIYSGQLRSLMNEDDLLIVISGSGNSKNVVEAVKYANEIKAKSFGILGYDGGNLKKMVDHHVLVPSFDMQLCEDFHLIIGHMIMKSLCNYTIKTN